MAKKNVRFCLLFIIIMLWFFAIPSIKKSPEGDSL